MKERDQAEKVEKKLYNLKEQARGRRSEKRRWQEGGRKIKSKKKSIDWGQTESTRRALHEGGYAGKITSGRPQPTYCCGYKKGCKDCKVEGVQPKRCQKFTAQGDRS